MRRCNRLRLICTFFSHLAGDDAMEIGPQDTGVNLIRIAVLSDFIFQFLEEALQVFIIGITFCNETTWVGMT